MDHDSERATEMLLCDESPPAPMKLHHRSKIHSFVTEAMEEAEFFLFTSEKVFHPGMLLPATKKPGYPVSST